MWKILIFLTMAALGCSIAACGSNSASPSDGPPNTAAANDHKTAASSRTISSVGYLKSDSDIDADDNHYKGPSNDDQWEMVSAQRHGATPSDKQAITTVVRGYYAAATDGDGAKGCMLLYPSLAAAITQEPNQRASDSVATCAKSLSRLFEQQHQHLTAENASTMVVTGVHVAGDVGYVTLGFKTSPEGEMLLQREGPAWKINALFDSPLP